MDITIVAALVGVICLIVGFIIGVAATFLFAARLNKSQRPTKSAPYYQPTRTSTTRKD